MSTTVFDRKKLANLLEELSILSGMGVSFWHPEKPLCIITTSNVPSPFCAHLQKSSVMKDACSQCEKQALIHSKSDYKTHYFTCHAGLTECISPVIYQESLLGFIMIGQIISTADNYQTIEKRRLWFENNGFDFEEVKKLYFALPIIPAERQLALLHMIEALASFVHIEGIVQKIEFPIMKRLENFIDEHLQEPISLSTVADSLRVSKSTICHMLQSERKTTLTKLINQKRTERVCQELKNGKTVVAAAAAAGFSSASYCSRVFLNIMGQRPEDYRRNALLKMDG